MTPGITLPVENQMTLSNQIYSPTAIKGNPLTSQRNKSEKEKWTKNKKARKKVHTVQGQKVPPFSRLYLHKIAAYQPPCLEKQSLSNDIARATATALSARVNGRLTSRSSICRKNIISISKKIGRGMRMSFSRQGTLPQKQGQSWSWDQNSQIELHTDQHQSKSAHLKIQLLYHHSGLNSNTQAKNSEQLTIKLFQPNSVK